MRAPIVHDRPLLANILTRCSVALAMAQQDLRETQPRVVTAGARLRLVEDIIDTITNELRDAPPGELPRRKRRR